MILDDVSDHDDCFVFNVAIVEFDYFDFYCLFQNNYYDSGLSVDTIWHLLTQWKRSVDLYSIHETSSFID